MSTFWSIWIIVIVAINIFGSAAILFANRKVEVRGDLADGEAPTTGHVYDGIEEFDNPLPGWWFKMFVITILFSFVYLALYPGLGNFQGFLGWSSAGQWQEEVDAAEAKYGPVYAQYAGTPIDELSANPEAMKMAGRLFANNCSQCHGSDARGAYGFPNLTDKDWLYGGEPEAIKTSIMQGRNGAMPAWGSVIKEEGVENVADYVFSLSGRKHDAAKAEAGAQVFATYCTACHGADGKGMQAMGAPNLTDDVWLYGGSPEFVKHTIRNGRNGHMPTHKELLKEDKIHLLAAYVYSLSK